MMSRAVNRKKKSCATISHWHSNRNNAKVVLFSKISHSCLDCADWPIAFGALFTRFSKPRKERDDALATSCRCIDYPTAIL